MDIDSRELAMLEERNNQRICVLDHLMLNISILNLYRTGEEKRFSSVPLDLEDET